MRVKKSEPRPAQVFTAAAHSPDTGGMTRRTLLMSLSGATLSACAPRGVLSMAGVSEKSKTQLIWVAAAPGTSMVAANPAFRDKIASISPFAHIEVSIPEHHALGQVEWPDTDPDPLRDFLVSDLENLTTEEVFLGAIAKDLSPDQEIGVFIHGFNTTYPEAIYRHAQIAHDFDLVGPQITFVWPSEGKPLGYLGDRDNVLVARDALLRFLERLTARFPNRVAVAAHSMGALLLMETLKQASVARRPLADRLAGLVLISPDIGMEVFISQVENIPSLPDQTLVIVSQKDRLLRLSQRLAGGKVRLGEGNDIDALQRLAIVVVDLSNATGGDPRNHLTAVTSPTAISYLRALIKDETVLTEAMGSTPLLLQFPSLL
ncbi:Esterase/lipase superfamily enzyme [Litoreibacter ascidiaceicola]|uniref:Esterase/lipase superfamily enzyme n=2 Tax=Litoreibacter ascidiaceicola TaxID=1486859 RepID=A0A1M5BPV0_9RHOB|nr:Esterase/lipase superfamily enzyme [Litoreibacter ascidiaceicola]